MKWLHSWKVDDKVEQDQTEWDWDTLGLRKVIRDGIVTKTGWLTVEVEWKRWSRGMGGGLQRLKENEWYWKIRPSDRSTP
jgi:hypothetical protein